MKKTVLITGALCTFMVLVMFFRNATNVETEQESVAQVTTSVEADSNQRERIRPRTVTDMPELKSQDFNQGTRIVKQSAESFQEPVTPKAEETTEEKPQWGSVILKPQASFGRTRK